jgi:Na+/H+-dicarboxylate symporter
MSFFRNIKLWHKVTAGLIAGVIVGMIFGEKVSCLAPIGEIFIKLIKMIIIPLIYLSIVIGMTNIKDSSTLSRIATKSIVAFLLTTSIAIVIGLSCVYILEPGKWITSEAFGSAIIDRSSKRTFDFMKLINDTIPDNALNALVSGKILQVVFFSFFTGIVVNSMGKEKQLICKGFQLAAKVVFKMIHLVLNLAPYGAFALTASVVGKQGIGVLRSLGLLIITMVIAMFIQYCVYGLIITIFARLSPRPFYRKSLEYQALAFSTSSSKATLATTMDVCANKIGISKNSTSFTLPLGAAINMDGSAIYLSIAALFFVQAYGITLSTFDYFIIILTSTLGSIGAAGIPSGCIIMLPMVLSAINVPIEGIALMVGIDRIVDMLRTTLNITGDATITLIVDKTEGTFNKKTYYTASDKLKEGESSLFK